MRRSTKKVLARIGSFRDDYIFYDITEGAKGTWYCTCPHNTYRHVSCKHMDILKKIISSADESGHYRIPEGQAVSLTDYAREKYHLAPSDTGFDI